METRLDFFDIEGETIFEETPEGFLTGVAKTTNIGVFHYKRQDGTVVRELRHPDDVFHPDSLASMANRPITVDHRTAKVTAKNFKKEAVGVTGEKAVVLDGLYVANPLTVMDEGAISAVKKGKRALSWAYDCEVVREDGVFMGTPYDQRQTNIRYDNLTIIDKARAGDAARIRMDGVMIDPLELDKEANDMPDEYKEIRIDGSDHKVAPVVYDRYSAAVSRVDGLEKELLSVKESVSVITAQKDDLQARLDSATAELAQAQKSLQQVQEDQAKAEIQAIAATLHLDGIVGDTAEDMKKKVILAKYPDAKLDGMDSKYIQGRFDGVVDSLKADAAADASARAVVGDLSSSSTEVRQDGAKDVQSLVAELGQRLTTRQVSK